MNNKKTAAVALSGGVDSGAAAFILKEQGYDVFGITMKLYEKFDTESAGYVAKKLNIKHYIVDYSDHFQKEIINKFIEEYLAGKTPNPCILCNMKIKYDLLLNEAKKLGADFLSTGHYAGIRYDDRDGKYHLHKSKASNKDQSYYLYHLNQEQLSHIILPLSEYENKKEVRGLVKEIIPETSGKKDSLNICFIENMSHHQYIKNTCGLINSKGKFIDENGKFLGYHKGIYNYTIGQKRGLGIKSDKPLFVVEINSDTGDIILGEDEATYRNEITVKNLSYIDENCKKEKSFNCEVKLCQWGYFISCTVLNIKDDTAVVIFHKKERAPAPGQAAVFYRGDEVLGGGIIV